MLLKGEQLTPARAKALGLLDAVVPAGRPPRRRPSAGSRRRRARSRRGTRTVSRARRRRCSRPQGFTVWPAANAHLPASETYDNYPGARAILSAVFEGLQLPFDQALKVEQRYFAHVIQSDEAAAMIRSLFVSLQELNKLARRPAEVAPTAAPQGSASSAPASWAPASPRSAPAPDSTVALLDRDAASAEKGKATVDGLACQGGRRAARLARGRQGGGARPHRARRRLRRARRRRPRHRGGVRGPRRQGGRDRAAPSRRCGPTRSSAPTPRRCRSPRSPQASPRPKDFIGIHFFSPVEKMMLVEVIMAKKTGDVALATALDFVRALRKTPIVVNDFARLLHLARGHHLHRRGPPDADRGRAARR